MSAPPSPQHLCLPLLLIQPGLAGVGYFRHWCIAWSRVSAESHRYGHVARRRIGHVGHFFGVCQRFGFTTGLARRANPRLQHAACVIAALWIYAIDFSWMFCIACWHSDARLAAVINPLSAMLYQGDVRNAWHQSGSSGFSRGRDPLLRSSPVCGIVILWVGRWQAVFLVAACVFLVCRWLFTDWSPTAPARIQGAALPHPAFVRMLGYRHSSRAVASSFIADARWHQLHGYRPILNGSGYSTGGGLL